MALNGLSKKLTARSRIMIAITGAIAVGAVAYTFTGGSAGSGSGTGSAKLDITPAKTDIDKDSLISKSMYDENSEIGKVYAADEKARREAAIKNQGETHLDGMKINLNGFGSGDGFGADGANGLGGADAWGLDGLAGGANGLSAEELAALRAKELEEAERRRRNAQSDLQRLMDERNAEIERRKALEQAERDAANRKKNGGAGADGEYDAANYHANAAMLAKTPWHQFVAGELKTAGDHNAALQKLLDRLNALAGAGGQMAVPIYYGNEDGGSSGSRSSSPQQQSISLASTRPVGIPITSPTTGAGGKQRPTRGSDGYNERMERARVEEAALAAAGGGNAPAMDMNDIDMSQFQMAPQAPQVSSYDYPSDRLAAMNKVKVGTNQKIDAGESFYAILQIGVNTDEISPIRAVVVENGKLKNAVFVGLPARTGEKALLTFNSMSINGKSYSINAIALDPDTMRSGVADGVDRHTFERYFKLFLASFTEGYADSLSGVQTTTNTDGSQSSIRESLPSFKDQAAVGVGKIGERFVPIFEKQFERQPTVTVNENKQIMMMFMEPVDLEKGK